MTAKAEATSLGIDQEKSTARTGTQAARVLPADVYDTLHFASLAFGGIRAGVFCDIDWSAEAPYHHNLNCPNCAHGLLMAAEGIAKPYAGELSYTLLEVGVSGYDSDEAVERVQQRDGYEDRIPFEPWARELNIVRGDS